MKEIKFFMDEGAENIAEPVKDPTTYSFIFRIFESLFPTISTESSSAIKTLG